MKPWREDAEARRRAQEYCDGLERRWREARQRRCEQLERIGVPAMPVDGRYE